MYKKLLSTLAIATTVLAGFVSATTPGLEREACIVSDTVYDQVATMQILYTDELTAERYETAQAIYDEMQALINQECGNTDGIISLQTSSQSSTCAMQVNQLLTYYTYNMELGREGIATAIRQNIESYLEDDACDELAANGTGPDALALNALLETTIDQTPDVIPYSRNICFLDNTVDDFVEQINNIAEQNVIESVDIVVDSLFDNANGITLSPLTQARQNTILTYARLVIENKMLEWMSGQNPSLSQLFTQYLAWGTNTINALLQSDGIVALSQLILNGPDLLAYFEALKTLYPSGTDFINSLQANPDISYTRNPLTAWFDIGSSDNGLQFVMPLSDTGVSNTGSTGAFVFTYRYYDGMSIPSTDGSGDPTFLPKRLIGDITQDGEQQMAFDLQVTYNDDNTPSNVEIDLYLNPYIINITLAFTDTVVGDTQIDAELQLFGPASCDFNIQLSMLNDGDIFADDEELEHPIKSMALTAAINNGIITRNFTNKTARDEAISAYELSSGILDPVAAVAGNAYFDADIYINDTHIADINAWDNMFILQTLDDYLNHDLLEEYIMTQQLDIMDIMSVVSHIAQTINQDKGEAIDATPKTILTQCIDDAGAIVDGYYYYTALDMMVSTYCLPAYDTCGTYDYTDVDKMDLYFRSPGKDVQCVNLDSTPPAPADGGDNNSSPVVFGCTDPAASNYDPKATKDDGSCVSVDTGTGESNTWSSEPTPVLGCTDPAATNYDPSATQDDNSCIIDSGDMGQGAGPSVDGCTDPVADNYNPLATQNDNSCTYPPVAVPGCTDNTATNYNPSATENDGSCTYWGQIFD